MASDLPGTTLASARYTGQIIFSLMVTIESVLVAVFLGHAEGGSRHFH